MLVRPTRRSDAAARLAREVVRNDCFDRLRSELGERFDDEVATRLVAVAGDVGRDSLDLDDDGRRLLASCDVVVHSAATVAFDAPLDTAVEVNLLGPSRVAAAIEAAAEARRRDHPDAAPTHLVTVSTAYVAGTHQGDATETLATEALASGARARTHSTVTTEVNIGAEVTAARRLRDDLESESARAGAIGAVTKAARAELGAAGTHLLAERAEKLRDEWVRAQLVQRGRSRAQALGWPDAYAFTKALGERALVGARTPTSPSPSCDPRSSSRRWPSPARAGSGDFAWPSPSSCPTPGGCCVSSPASPRAWSTSSPWTWWSPPSSPWPRDGPDPDGPTVYHVASSVRNPLRYGELVDLVRSWFTEHPLYDSDGQPIMVPEWSFPGRGRVQRQLQRANRALTTAERVLGSLPVRGERADLAARVEEKRAQAERALGYTELYGAYTETEAHFRVDRLLSLWERLAPPDRELFCFDPGVISWPDYVHDVHLPSVVEHARVRSTPRRSTMASRSDRARSAILAPERHLAAFDLENTLVASNVVESYAWLASRHLPVGERVAFTARILREAPGLLALDRRDRGDFLRTFYRRYEGAPSTCCAPTRRRCSTTCCWPSRSRPGFARVRAHRALGHRTVLITGALDFVVEPLRPLFDEVVCARWDSTPSDA